LPVYKLLSPAINDSVEKHFYVIVSSSVKAVVEKLTITTNDFNKYDNDEKDYTRLQNDINTGHVMIDEIIL
jgi:hypothetical protein